MSFLAILTLIFVVLKLLHFIAWSWWLVFAPLIGEAAVDLLILTLVVSGAVFLQGRKK